MSERHSARCAGCRDKTTSHRSLIRFMKVAEPCSLTQSCGGLLRVCSRAIQPLPLPHPPFI